jgi:hypothetical protein
MRKALILGWALAASPLVAQTSNVPAPPPASAPLEPAHLALARTTIDFVWPLGTYERMMKGTMDKMMDAMFQSMFDMKLTDIVPQTGKNAPDPKAANLTMREMMEKADPHFQERLRITTRVMMEEMIPMMNRVEPDIRAGLARAYARKFTDEQLADMNRFFATPSGRVYASEAMLTMMDPEVMSSVMKFAPEFIREMPGIMAKVQAATASLPPPPKHSVDIKR